MISEGKWGIYQSKESPKTKHIFAGEHALDPNAIIIAAVSGQDYEDNAHLIAASKLLLAACKMLADALIHVEGDTKGNKVRTAIIPLLKGAANKGREAIAKAENN